MNFLISEAYAQAEAAAPAQPSIFQSMVPFILIFFVFYFLMIRPQKKKLEKEQSFLSGLKKGDEVYTKSGILGTVQGIADRVVTLEVEGNVRFKILKSQVAGSSKTLFETAKKDDKVSQAKPVKS